jgi:hypothetical protein
MMEAAFYFIPSMADLVGQLGIVILVNIIIYKVDEVAIEKRIIRFILILKCCFRSKAKGLEH